MGLGKLISGVSLHRELELLCESGLTPLEALRAATLTAARALRKEGEIGCLKPGAFADLVVLDADPIADIRNARKIHLVMKGSRVYDPAPAAGPEKSAKGSC
jgi:imidazolonepropionase-like amidohydrolase